MHVHVRVQMLRYCRLSTCRLRYNVLHRRSAPIHWCYCSPIKPVLTSNTNVFSCERESSYNCYVSKARQVGAIHKHFYTDTTHTLQCTCTCVVLRTTHIVLLCHVCRPCTLWCSSRKWRRKRFLRFASSIGTT